MKTRRPFLKKNCIVGLALAIIAALTISIVAQAAAGGLDPSFGTGGKVTTYVSGSNSFANAVAVQSDSKIVVVGGSQVVRYNSNGTLDITFGTNGIVTNSGIGGGMALVIQPDGKIVVVGFSGGGLFTCFHVARFNSNGSPDATFGTNGIAIPLTFQNQGANESGVRSFHRARAKRQNSRSRRLRSWRYGYCLYFGEPKKQRIFGQLELFCRIDGRQSHRHGSPTRWQDSFGRDFFPRRFY